MTSFTTGMTVADKSEPLVGNGAIRLDFVPPVRTNRFSTAACTSTRGTQISESKE
jgi:hypothetical protein